MAEPWLRQSPLAHRALESRVGDGADGAALALAERRFLAKVNVRGEAAPAAVERAVGAAPPAEPDTVAAGAGLHILWLGPAEWLVVGPPGAEKAIEDRLVEALSGASAAVVDVTEGRSTIRVSGPMARDVLSMGCPLDLHPRVFGAGRCAQSLIARAPVVLHLVDGAAAFDVHVERSQTDYLWTWFETAGAPYGVAVAPEPEAPPWRPPARRRDGE